MLPPMGLPAGPFPAPGSSAQSWGLLASLRSLEWVGFVPTTSLQLQYPEAEVPFQCPELWDG